jgi:hypothetical protein
VERRPGTLKVKRKPAAGAANAVPFALRCSGERPLPTRWDVHRAPPRIASEFSRRRGRDAVLVEGYR